MLSQIGFLATSAKNEPLYSYILAQMGLFPFQRGLDAYL